MHRGVPRVLAAVAVAVASALVVTGCTPVAPATLSTPSSSPPVVYTSTMPPLTGLPSMPTPTGLTSDQLYDKAVATYRQFFALISQMELRGGADRLPNTARQYLMEPAWGAVEQCYAGLHARGDKYVGTPYLEIQRIAPNDEADPPAGTLVTIKTCDLAQGAPMLRPDGSTVQDGSPVIQYRRSYFKFDTDGWFKLFDIDGEWVKTCPFD